MKFTFVYCDFIKGSGGKYYEGIASISAVLKKNGYITKLFHMTEHIGTEKFINIFDTKYADSNIVAFSSTTNVFYYVATYAREIKKKYKNIMTICGGIHPTLCPEDAIQEDGIDIICIGEGEYPMLDLCAALASNNDISHIQNLWVNKNGKVIKNAIRPLIENLDSLPIPDRTIFDYNASMDRKSNRLVFMASRGCPFQCTHCCNHAIKKLYPNTSSYARYKSSDSLINEIKYYLRIYKGMKYICFHDDNLTLNENWFQKFIFRYAEEIRLPYICNSRFDLMDEEIVELLGNTGCIEVRIGLESGDDFVRKDILKRNQNREDIIRIGRLCRKKGIRLYIFTMIGIPFEDMNRALKTVKLTAQLKPATIQTSIYYPYPKTDLYNLCREKGFLTNKRLDSYFNRETILSLPNFSRDKIIFAYDNFEIFVKGYEFISIFTNLYNTIFEKLVDFLWLNSKGRVISKTLISCYRFIRKFRLAVYNYLRQG